MTDVAAALFNRFTIPAWCSVAWPVSAVTARLTGKALEALPAGSKVLDIGVGTGATASYLARQHQFQVDGVDISPDMLESASVPEGVKLYRGDARDLPTPAGQYDAVVLNHVARYIPPEDAERVFDQVGMATRPGGIVVITDLALPRLRPRRQRVAGSFDARVLGLWSRFSRGDMAAFAASKGFQHIRNLYPPFSFMMIFKKQGL